MNCKCAFPHLDNEGAFFLVDRDVYLEWVRSVKVMRGELQVAELLESIGSVRDELTVGFFHGIR